MYLYVHCKKTLNLWQKLLRTLLPTVFAVYLKGFFKLRMQNTDEIIQICHMKLPHYMT